jgi:hypothetical protein
MSVKNIFLKKKQCQFGLTFYNHNLGHETRITTLKTNSEAQFSIHQMLNDKNNNKKTSLKTELKQQKKQLKE